MQVRGEGRGTVGGERDGGRGEGRWEGRGTVGGEREIMGDDGRGRGIMGGEGR